MTNRTSLVFMGVKIVALKHGRPIKCQKFWSGNGAPSAVLLESGAVGIRADAVRNLISYSSQLQTDWLVNILEGFGLIEQAAAIQYRETLVRLHKARNVEIWIPKEAEEFGFKLSKHQESVLERARQEAKQALAKLKTLAFGAASGSPMP